MTNYEIRFFPRQSYCLNLLKVIEDTGGYNGAHVYCQRRLCRYYEGTEKYCATNGQFSKTFRNRCLLCAKGCEELNRGRRMYRSEYTGECRERDPGIATTDASSTLETSIKVTSAPKGPFTKPSTSQSSTHHTTSLKESTYFGTTSILEDVGDSSFTIVVNGSTVKVSTTQPFTSPFTSATTSDSPYLSTEEYTTLESFSITSSTQFTSPYVVPSTSLSVTNTSLSTPSSTLTTDIKTTGIESSFQPHETTIDIEEGKTRDLKTDGMITSQSEVPALSEVPTEDQTTTLTTIFFTGKTDVIGTTLSTGLLHHETTMSSQEGKSIQLETDAFITLETDVPAVSELLTVDLKTKLSSHSFTPVFRTVGGLEVMEPQELQTRCKKERHKLNHFKQRYQINPYLEEHLCVKNYEHFLINCKTIKTRYERLSTSIPDLPNIY